MNGFTPIGKYLWKCNNCEAKVESGIVPISTHWNNCRGKGFKIALMKAAENNELTLEKVKEIKTTLNLLTEDPRMFNAIKI